MRNNFTIEFISIHDLDAKEWNNFLLSTSESTFFCTTDWWRTFDGTYILQIRDNNQLLVAGIPFRILSVIPLIGRYFKFCWLDSSALVNQNFEESEIYNLKKMAFESLIKYLRKSQVIVMIISSKTRSHDALLFKELFNNVEKSATLVLDLTKDVDEIVGLFSDDKKYSVRKAQRMGVKTKIFEGKTGTSLIPEYCRLQNKLFEHKGRSYSNIYYKSESYLNSILSASSTKSYIAISYLNDQPVAGDVFVSYNKIIYNYLGASDYFLNRTSQASSLLQYDMIKFAKSSGYDTYDFGGISTNPDPSDSLYGIYNFKKDFGGCRFEYDHASYILRKRRYWIIKKMRKYENHSVFRFIYNLLKKQ